MSVGDVVVVAAAGVCPKENANAAVELLLRILSVNFHCHSASGCRLGSRYRQSPISLSKKVAIQPRRPFRGHRKLGKQDRRRRGGESTR